MADPLRYEIEETAPVRQRGEAPCASVLYHRGMLHFVTHRSAPERRLLEAGALHVGMVRFDAAPAPAAPPRGRPLVLGGAPAPLAWGSRSS
jgi:hypothetical protein